MTKNSLVLLLGALLLAGCGKSAEEIAAEKEAAAQAAEVAALAAKKAAGPTEEEKAQAGEAFVTLVCSTPQLLEQAETSLDLYEALSGDGGDRAEGQTSYLKAQKYFRARIQLDMTSRGNSYEALLLYANQVLPPQADPDKTKVFRLLAKAHCRDTDEAQAERLLLGILNYCARPAP